MVVRSGSEEVVNVCVLVKISSSNRSKCLSSILFAKKILFSLIITSLFLSLSLSHQY